MAKYSYGWVQSKRDDRDLRLKLEKLVDEKDLPKVADYRKEFSMDDQGALGCCTADSSTALVERVCKNANYPFPFKPSRLFVYWNSRNAEGTVDEDAGAELRDVIKSINEFGVCPESQPSGEVPPWFWTFDDGPVKFRLKPKDECYKDALLHRALKYESIPLNRLSVLNALAQGKCFVFGFPVYSSFESDDTAKTGIMRVPSIWESLEGGHAVVAVGYILDQPMGHDGVKDWIIVRNSWSANWGQNGFFLMPLKEVFLRMASDAWSIGLVGPEAA